MEIRSGEELAGVREWLARREFAAGAGKGGFKYGYVRTYD